jgi:hypothetical protein
MTDLKEMLEPVVDFNAKVDDELILLFHSLTKANYLGEQDDVLKNYPCNNYSDV